MSDAAVTSLVTGAVTITTLVVGFLTLWVKLKYATHQAKLAAQDASNRADVAAKKVGVVEEKIDTNTALTRAGTEAASASAMMAASTATEAKEAALAVAAKMNGGVDTSIEAAIKPIRDALTDHILQYEQDMRNIRDTLAEIRKGTY